MCIHKYIYEFTVDFERTLRSSRASFASAGHEKKKRMATMKSFVPASPMFHTVFLSSPKNLFSHCHLSYCLLTLSFEKSPTPLARCKLRMHRMIECWRPRTSFSSCRVSTRRSCLPRSYLAEILSSYLLQKSIPAPICQLLLYKE